MTTRFGRVEWVATEQARSFLTAAAAISDTTLNVEDGNIFATDELPGSVELPDGSVVSFDSWTDTTVELTDPLVVAIDEGDPVSVYPERLVRYAGVNFAPDDEWSETVQCRIPHGSQWFVSLAEGPFDDDARPVVEVDMSGDPVLVDVVNEDAVVDASTTPIVVTTDAGESVRIDGDGIRVSTNDLLVKVLEITGPVDAVAADGGLIFGTDSITGDIEAYDGTTGDLLYTITGTFGSVAASSGFLYGIDSAGDINRWLASDGTPSGGGFPIAASFGTNAPLSADGGRVYAIDTSSDIKGYDESGGPLFTITGTFTDLAASGDYVYAIDSAGDVRKYDGLTGVEDTSAFPLVGDYGAVAADDGQVYAQSNVDDHAYGYDTESAAALPWFPITGTIVGALSAGDGYLLGVDNSDAIVKYSTGLTSEISINIDAITGSIRAVLQQFYATHARRAGAQNIGTGSDVKILFDTFSGSARNGPFWAWHSGNREYDIEQDGLYSLAASVLWPTNTTGIRILRILINGNIRAAEVLPDAPGVASLQNVSIPDIILDAGDTVAVEVHQTSGVSLNIASTATWLTISRRGVVAA